jgi:transcriptional regulator with XRE-family HTH domain
MSRLKTLRDKRGWSQAELARRSGLNATTISLIESGRLVPYPAQAEKLAHALELSPRQAAALMREAS